MARQAKKQSRGRFDLVLPGRWQYLRMKTILDYEAGVRGLTASQAAADIALAQADIDSYPDEVRERVEELLRQAEREAAGAIAGDGALGSVSPESGAGSSAENAASVQGAATVEAPEPGSEAASASAGEGVR